MPVKRKVPTTPALSASDEKVSNKHMRNKGVSCLNLGSSVSESLPLYNVFLIILCSENSLRKLQFANFT